MKKLNSFTMLVAFWAVYGTAPLAVAAECPGGTQEVFVTSVSVPATTPDITSSPDVLTLDETYLFRASGTYVFSANWLPAAGIADATCSLRLQGFNNPGPGPQWIPGANLSPPFTNWLEIRVDDEAFDWGDVCDDVAHEYSGLYLGDGTAVDFSVIDDGYADNSVGDLTVDIYFCEPPIDDDGVPAGIDNCIEVFNPEQRDTDNDLVGNLCDPDIAVPNDCLVNFADLNAMKAAFFSGPASPGWNADADLNGDDGVNFGDLNIMKDMFFRPPGPSGRAPVCVGGQHNFAGTGMQVVGDPGRITIGHPAQLEIGISSDRPAGSVTADILIINKAAYDPPSTCNADCGAVPPGPACDLSCFYRPAHNDQFRIRIGQVTIPQVMEGTHNYPASVQVPYTRSEVSEVIVSNLDILSIGPASAGCLLQPFSTAADTEVTSVTVRIDPGTTIPVLTVVESSGAVHTLQSPSIPADHPPGDYVFTANSPIPLVASEQHALLIYGDVAWSISALDSASGGTGMIFPVYYEGDQFCDPLSGQFCCSVTGELFGRPLISQVDAIATTPIWDPIAAGEYYLYAEIDPENSFDESDESDNVPMDAMGDFTVGDGAEIVQAGAEFLPNIYVENLGIDLGNLGFDPGMLATSLVQGLGPAPATADFCSGYPVHEDNSQPSYIGLNARVNSSGAYWPQGGAPGDRPQPIPRVDISGGLEIDNTVYPVKFWDTATASYVFTQSIYDLTPGAARDGHLDVVLETDVLIGFVEQLIGSFTITSTFPFFEISPGLCGEIWAQNFTIPPSEQTLDLMYECILDKLADTQLSIDIIAMDAGGTPIGEFNPPGFPYTNDWPPDPLDPDTWPPVTITIMPLPDDVLAIAYGLLGLTPPTPPPPPTPPAVQAYDYSWEKSMGGEFASAGVSFYAGMGIDGEASPGDPAGAFATVDGRIPVSLFGYELDLFRAYFEARGLNTAWNPDNGLTYWEHNYFEYDVQTPNRFFEPAIQLFLVDTDPLQCGEQFSIFDLTAEYPDSDDCDEANCPTNPEPGDDQSCNHCDDPNDPLCNASACSECRAEQCLSFSFQDSVEQIFVIGIVPLTVEFTAGATAGLAATADFPACSDVASGPSELELRAGPYVDVGASLSAYIDLVLASGGATAELTLLNDTFEAYARVEALDHDATTIEGQLQIGLENTLTGPNGEGYLWAQYPCVNQCRVCVSFLGCFSIPCPGTCRDTLPLFEFETFTRTDPLYCKATPGIVTVTRQ